MYRVVVCGNLGVGVTQILFFLFELELRTFFCTKDDIIFQMVRVI